MRILGLDYGSKTVGVAVSDPLGLTAQKAEHLRVLKSWQLSMVWKKLLWDFRRI